MNKTAQELREELARLIEQGAGLLNNNGAVAAMIERKRRETERQLAEMGAI